MTENVYGRWKARFPILRQLRVFLPMAQKIILATGILSNMAVVIDEPEEEDDIDEEEEGDDDDDQDRIQVDLQPNIVRQLGNAERDLHLLSMGP